MRTFMTYVISLYNYIVAMENGNRNCSLLLYEELSKCKTWHSIDNINI